MNKEKEGEMLSNDFMIKFYEVQFLYLNDQNYFREYNEENNLSDEEIDTRLDELQTNYFEVEIDEVTIDDLDYETLVSLLEDECGEYFGDFKYEIISS